MIETKSSFLQQDLYSNQAGVELHRVLGLDVPLELSGPGECLTAVRTLVRLLSQMDTTNMITEGLLPGE